jgi:hypothetical protein
MCGPGLGRRPLAAGDALPAAARSPASGHGSNAPFGVS